MMTARCSWGKNRRTARARRVLRPVPWRLALFFCLLAWGNTAGAQGFRLPPGQDWKTRSSEHFYLHYPARLRALAEHVLVQAERLHPPLTRALRWEGREKTHIVLTDDVDTHNGLATVLPRNFILLYAAESEPGDTIYEPGDYLSRTFIHEYVHVLTMDPRYGFRGVLTGLFGKAPAPFDPLSLLVWYFSVPTGATLPNWWLEGVAQWAETEFTAGGRGRAALTEMMLRADVAAGGLPKFSDLHLLHPRWPYGGIVYLYGLEMIRFLVETYGSSVGEPVGELSHRHAGRRPLFGFADGSLALTGAGYDELWPRFIAALERRQQARIARLARQPFTNLPRLSPRQGLCDAPAFSPDGRKVYFVFGPRRGKTRLWAYDVVTGVLQQLGGRANVGSRLSVARDGRFLYYASYEVSGGFFYYSDLYRLDLESGAVARLTCGRRLKFPVVSPDGASFCAVMNEDGAQVLVLGSLAETPAGGEKSPLLCLERAPYGVSLAHPDFAPDGRSVVYARAGEGRAELVLCELASRQKTVLLKDRSLLTYPRFLPEGQAVVYSSDRTGVYNLYRLDLKTRESTPLTHCLTGVFHPAPAPDGKRLALIGYDAEGFYLTLLDYPPHPAVPAPLPVIAAAWKTKPGRDRERTAAAQAPAPPLGPEKNYRGLRYLAPRWWLPTLGAGNGLSTGVVSSTFDPLGFHQFDLSAGWEFISQTYYYSTAYTDRRLPPEIRLFSSHFPLFYGEIIEDVDGRKLAWAERRFLHGASVTAGVVRRDWRLSATIGYEHSWREGINAWEAEVEKLGAPLVRVPFEGAESTGLLRLEYGDVAFYPRSVGPEDGRIITAWLRHSDRHLGGELGRTRVFGSWFEYLASPLGETHLLLLRAYGGHGWGEETAQGHFQLGGYSFGALWGDEGASVPLRGYGPAAFFGDSFWAASLAYRLELVPFHSGPMTWQIYFRSLVLEVFYDSGAVYDEAAYNEQRGRIKQGAGVEVSLHLAVLAEMVFAPAVGLAHGFDRDQAPDYVYWVSFTIGIPL